MTGILRTRIGRSVPIAGHDAALVHPTSASRLLAHSGCEPIPSHDSDAQDTTDTAEHQRDDTPSREPGRQWIRSPVLARQVKQVACVARRVPGSRYIGRSARIKVIARDAQRLLQLERRLDHGGYQARGDVPFYVAVEEPDTGVVRSEAQDDVAFRIKHKGIPTHWNLGEVGLGNVGVGEDAGFLGRAVDGLEGVAVKVEGVTASVEIVDHYLHHFVLFQDERVGVSSINLGIGSGFTGCQGRVEGGNFGCFVSDVVEKGAGKLSEMCSVALSIY